MTSFQLQQLMGGHETTRPEKYYMFGRTWNMGESKSAQVLDDIVDGSPVLQMGDLRLAFKSRLGRRISAGQTVSVAPAEKAKDAGTYLVYIPPKDSNAKSYLPRSLGIAQEVRRYGSN